MKVKIQRLDEKAVVPFKTHEGDFCYDVVATSEEEVHPGVWKYGLGWAMELVRDTEMIERSLSPWEELPSKSLKLHRSPLILSIDLRPRSSIWKTGMILSNCEGTVDEIFRGGVSATFYHIKPELPRYKVGDRIGQIKVGITFPLTFEEVYELSETARGAGSYGSTGK